MARPDRAPPVRHARPGTHPAWRNRRAAGIASFRGPSFRAGEQRGSLPVSREPTFGVERLLSVAELEVEVRAVERAGLADGADLVAGVDFIADRLLELIEVRHQREDPVAVVDDEEVSEALEPAGVRDLAVPDRVHRRAERR